MNRRLLGIMMAIGALFVMLNNFRTTAVGIKPFSDSLGSVAYVLWGIGGVCGVIGLIRQNVLGTNALARAVGLLPILGFISFILGDGLKAVGLIHLDDSLYIILSSIAWISMLAGMLVVSILTIAAKTWKGWQRFVPLVAIVMFPIALGIGQTVNNLYAGAFLGDAPWILLGYVIATAEVSPALQQGAMA
jgi:hypothetical protein